jgi:hypothetical protein
MRPLSANPVVTPFLFRASPALPVFLFLLLLLQSCATSQFTAGEQKNRLPVADRMRLEEVHSIAVPPFYRDDYHWERLVREALATPTIAVIPTGRVDAALKEAKKDLSTLDPRLRTDALAKIGRSVRADAVLNGIVLSRGDRRELILQLISSRDSRLLFWQAAEFSLKGSRTVTEGQRRLVLQMLEPLVAHAARRQKPVLPAPTAAEPAPAETREELPAPHRPVQEKRHKKDGEREKGPVPAVPPEEISPM